MENSLLLYLFQASLCVAVFSLTYRLLLARLTEFAWNRAYLLGALVASTVLPLLSWPGLAAWLAPVVAGPAASAGPLAWTWQWTGAVAASAASSPAQAAPTGQWLLLAVLGCYAAGAGWRLWSVGRDLRWVFRLLRRHPRTRQAGYWLVRVAEPPLPAFSFGSCVVLSAAHDGLSSADRELVLLHEAAHVRQYHTHDLLLAELVGVLLWFNPLVKYLKTQLKDVHEYLADHAVARTADPRHYGRLLVQLAAQQPPVPLVHALSSKQIFSRIHTLTNPPSSSMKKLRFLLVMPVAASTWLAMSAFNVPETVAGDAAMPVTVAAPQAGHNPIGRITWQGNTVVSTARLNQALGLKPGDAYDSLTLAKRLNYNPAGDVASLYMDQGYLFFSLTPVARHQPNGTTDLAFTLSEGPQVRVRNVEFVGNQRMTSGELARLVPVKAGDLFSRAKLMQAQKLLAESGRFDPKKVGINPKPVMVKDGPPTQADVEFVLVEKK